MIVKSPNFTKFSLGYEFRYVMFIRGFFASRYFPNFHRAAKAFVAVLPGLMCPFLGVAPTHTKNYEINYTKNLDTRMIIKAKITKNAKYSKKFASKNEFVVPKTPAINQSSWDDFGLRMDDVIKEYYNDHTWALPFR